MEALSVLIATKQVADDIRDSNAAHPHHHIPTRRRSRTSAARRWFRQLVGASARSNPVDFKSDHKPAGISA
ncbi:hypothetical protein GCM10009745_84490 [Kribbella yunnanensis]|uniref:Uncharacterized protein n=1 Tax=Kribbella yunnanensis TaxID=190194 RepID=A0ABP4VFC1_9ACTN